jgi:hypothetical protein
MSPPSSDAKNKPSKYHRDAGYVSPKRRLTFNGVISRKIKLFVTSDVRVAERLVASQEGLSSVELVGQWLVLDAK